MVSQRYAKHAPTLVELGYDVTPVVGKRPILEGWAQRPDTALEFDKHADKSIGILLGGKRNLVAIDVDVTNPFASIAIEKLIKEELGYAPRRVGKAPKFLMVFRNNEPTRKIKTAIYEIDGDDCAVEVLAEGQQFVASGIHPDTGKRYEWPDDSIMDMAIDDLPEITTEQISVFLRQAETVLSQYGSQKTASRDPKPKTASLNLTEKEASLGEVTAALDALSNNDLHYDEWVEIAHAVKGAAGDGGKNAFFNWSAKSSKHDDNECERLWQSITSVNKIGAGTIFHLAAEDGFDIQAYRHRHQKPVQTNANDAANVVSMEDHEEFNFKPMSSRPGVNELETRKFLYGRHLIRGYVSATISPGGIGKTTLIMAEAIAMAANKEFLGERIFEDDLRALHINLEDPQDELDRRYYALLKHFEINHEDIGDRVYMHSGRDRKIILADKGEHGTVIQMPDADLLRSQIIKHRIDAVSIDPIVKAHYLDENDNKHIDQLMTIMGQVAHDTGCAIDLASHTRKAPTGVSHAAGDINQARGAGSLSGAVRAARTLTVMSLKEAENFGITADRAGWYVRVDDAKGNMTPPAAHANWYERHSVRIDNGGPFTEGDSVGVMQPWTPPDAFEGLTQAVIDRILNAIIAGVDDAGTKYSFRAQSNRWVGDAIKDNCLDKTDADAKQIIITWRNSGLLFEEDWDNPSTRKTVKAVMVDAALWPGREVE